MKATSTVRRIRLVIGLFFLHAMAWVALLAVLTTFWRCERNRTVLGYWAVSMTLAGGLASVVYGGTSIPMEE